MQLGLPGSSCSLSGCILLLTCFATAWVLLALWAAQPDGKRFSTRTSPGKDSDWLGLDPVPIPGPITVAHLESYV